MIKNIKKTLLLVLVFVNVASLFAEAEVEVDTKKGNFSEIWAYVMAGEESNILGTEPITDLCYFAGSISFAGELIAKSKFPSAAKKPQNVRMHLVIADTQNKSLIHFLISPEFNLREKFMNDLAIASADYDGVQIDFEMIDKTDKDNFLSFLKQIKTVIGNKTLSIALPARVAYKNDAFSYESIAPLVDKIFIMAYDEHWSGSKPGAVASIAWCGNVVKYVASVISPEKLVMGMPFYGRSWQDKKYDKALKFTTTQDMVKNKTDLKILEGMDPGFEYTDSVTVTVYYDNQQSLLDKANVYSLAGVKNIGFWRVGQESKEVWDVFKNSNT